MTYQVNIGNIAIGADNPIAIQSMTKTDTRDVASTVGQIRELAESGCDIVRMAVNNMEAAAAIGEIRRAAGGVPLVADIHFDYRLALESVRQGIDKVRINPGNIGDRSRVRQVAEAAKERGVPIRIGVNGGSLDRALMEKHGGVTAAALVESAVTQAEILNLCGFYDIVVSIKSSDVFLTVEACRLFDEKNTGIPQHIGVTEAGTPVPGIVKSTIGLYELLRGGVGDTVRVSLTGDPVDEVAAAKTLLQTLAGAEDNPLIRPGGLTGHNKGVELVSCPTCGRCGADLIGISREIERRINKIRTGRHIKIAVMGCAVNGPDEAKSADVGVAFGGGTALLFKRGERLYSVPEHDVIDALMKELALL